MQFGWGWVGSGVGWLVRNAGCGWVALLDVTRHSPVSPQSGKLVPQRIVVIFLLLLRQEMKSKQGGEEAKAGLSPDHGVQTHQALQGDEELGGGEQVEGGEHQGDR